MHVRLLGLLLLGLSACNGAESGVSTENLAQGSSPETLDSVLLNRWWRTCALCHINGQGGAPRMGNMDEWQPRLVQSDGEMLRHTIEGYNNMPPLGYCMSCSREDLIKLIGFMSGVPQ